MNPKIQALLDGKQVTTSEKGQSMVPLIRSGQEHVLTPEMDWMKFEVGDIAYCRVSGRMFTHLVTAKDPHRGLQISNNHGWVNGWTKTTYGKVTEVL